VPRKRMESSWIVVEGRRSTVSAVLPHIREQTGVFGSRPKQRDGLAADGEEGHVEPSCRLRYRTLAQGRRLDVGLAHEPLGIDEQAEALVEGERGKVGLGLLCGPDPPPSGEGAAP